MTDHFKLTRPCAKCPFRTDVPGYLRPERAREIVMAILGDQTFHCHATLDYDTADDEDGVPDTAGGKQCAGSMILLEKLGQPNQMMRITERLGMYDRTRLHMDSPVVSTPAEFIAHHGGDDEPEPDGEPCSWSGPKCVAPAGYLVGGQIIDGTQYTDLQCSECFEHVCEECAPNGVCPGCLEDREEASAS